MADAKTQMLLIKKRIVEYMNNKRIEHVFIVSPVMHEHTLIDV